MTREKLIERLKEELADVATYGELYEQATDTHDACIFEDIANDEFSHACALQQMIGDTSDDPEIQEGWAKAKKLFHIYD